MEPLLHPVSDRDPSAEPTTVGDRRALLRALMASAAAGAIATAAGGSQQRVVTAQSAAPTGPTGRRGPTGPLGITGPGGVTGPAGPSPTGPTGAAGSTGPAGLRGGTGLRGPKGPIGPTGKKGSVGPRGAIGPSYTVTTTESRYCILPRLSGSTSCHVTCPAGFIAVAGHADTLREVTESRQDPGNAARWRVVAYNMSFSDAINVRVSCLRVDA